MFTQHHALIFWSGRCKSRCKCSRQCSRTLTIIRCSINSRTIKVHGHSWTISTIRHVSKPLVGITMHHHLALLHWLKISISSNSSPMSRLSLPLKGIRSNEIGGKPRPHSRQNLLLE
ncbi:hypothetical protein V8G54_031385 [Vigna mungo]|uniref:Uncharacterized protein n=1 Tax=Vigna mungo TaxID=3915 RepID=A0AAQ3MWQ0_VIGMU